MRYTFSDENIEKAVEYAAAYMEANSIGRKEIRRWSLLMEQLLWLYGRDGCADGFSLVCRRRKKRISIRLCVESAEKDYLSSGEDFLVARLLSGFENAPGWSYRNGCNTISYEAAIRVPDIWSLRFLLPYLRRTKGYCFCAIFAQLCMIAADIVIPVVTARIITAYTDSEIRRIVILAVALSLTGIVSYLCDYISTFFFVKVYNRLLNDLETDLSRRVFHLEDACIGEYGSGMFVQRMVSDTENVASGFNNITEALAFLAETVGIIIAVGIISLPLCLFFIVSIGLTAAFEIRRIKKRGQDDREFRRKKDRYSSFITEMIYGVRDIKLQNSTEVFVEKMSQSIREANESNYVLEKNSARRVFVRKGVKELCDMVLYAGMALLMLVGYLLPSAALVIFNYNLSISSFGFYLGNFLNYINTISVSSERIFQILFSPNFREEKFGTLCPEEFQGNISFRNVSFSYAHDGPEGTGKKALDQLSMEIRAKEKVAIVGKSGSGKTTIINLLTGLYRPDSGKILIDGRDYETLSADYLRGNISVVSQNPYIFNLTIRENLNLAGSGISFEEIERACRAACIYDDIMTMPQKFDTLLGEGGIHLSGGQRQRLAIARCLLRKTRMILLDEATSALDNETQNDVIGEIGKLFSDCTVITVAHRLSTIENSDRILFLSNGGILADGSHGELLASCAEYRALYRPGQKIVDE